MDHTTITPEERENLIQETLDMFPQYTREELLAMQRDRLYGDLEGFEVHPPGTPVPSTKPVPPREHSWEKAVSDQFGDPQN